MDVKEKRLLIESMANQNMGVPVQVLGCKENHLISNNVIVINNGTDEYQNLFGSNRNGYANDVDIHYHKLLDQVLKDKKNKNSKKRLNYSNDRGNVTIQGGYSSLNLKVGEDNDVACPCLMDSTNKTIVQLMMFLTTVLSKTYKLFDIEPKDCLVMDGMRNKQFAQAIVEKFGMKGKNVFEALTVGITWTTLSTNKKECDVDSEVNEMENKQQQMINCHVDQLNDDEKGHNVTVCHYHHVLRGNVLYRIAILGYMHIRIYFVRDTACHLLKENLVDFMNHNKERWYPSVKDVPVNKEITFKLPTFDKMGFYSAYVSCLMDLIDACGGAPMPLMRI